MLNCQPKQEKCLLGSNSGKLEPGNLLTPGFGLDPKLGLEGQGLGSNIMADCLCIMQITLSVNSVDPDGECCR